MIATLFLSGYPRDSICQAALDAIEQGRLSNTEKSGAWIRNTNLANAFLDITDRHLTIEDMRSQKSAEILLRGFEGFIVEQTTYGKRQGSKVYGQVLTMLSDCFGFELESAITRQKESSKRYADSIAYYESCAKNLGKLTYYEGWYLKANTGEKKFIQLSQFYKQYGQKHTNYYLQIMKNAFKKYSEDSVAAYIKQMSFMTRRICATYPSIKELKRLTDPVEVNNFTEQCFSYGLLHTIAKSNKLESFYQAWADIVATFKKSLVGSYFIAEPAHPIITPSFKTSVQTYKNKDNDYDRTLTPIPLTLKDDGALEVLESQLKKNRDYLIKICRASCAQELASYRRYRNLARRGTVISLDRAKVYPDDFSEADLCATWRKAPYINKRNLTSLNILQDEIKAPLYTLKSRTLLPFMYLLVIYNPAITQSWFKSFELYNRHNMMTGFTQSASGWKARSRKKRAKKMQIVSLDHKSVKLFKSMIKLSEEARNYLKDKGSQAWRYLLLANRGGLEVPTRMKNIPSWKNEDASGFFKANLLSGIPSARPDKHMTTVVSRLTLKGIRADQIVIKYFDSLSEVEASKAAGHTRHTRALMARYIPPAIRHFLMSRWLRQFQNAIIYDVMKDSDYLLRSMDFNTEEDLNLFLQNIRPDYDFEIKSRARSSSSELSTGEESDRIYISLNKQKLIVLLTIYEMGVYAASKGIRLTEGAVNWFRIASLVRVAGNLANEGQLGTACSQAAAHLLKNTQPSSDVANRLAGVIYA
ncbi:hypothetical protein V476_21890 [Pseudomonas syringae KCTC 12500]|uniref:hypothetical protein n=1 Tax=Pseudomonas syringae TaxID=317 RepID=UPI0004285470|nr:hypothetical protein [Pseudomonas syringae]KMY03629.1 hypothetical protein V476_21890 [Pseudomonas syringae KCTC 12500]KPY74779.1 Uncharacterized protein ALO45_03728 [Pseudomonas syringae pv. syringae]POR85150.1 hypothetical protein BKM21_14115 [Pseudomonas syringae pv. syringae]